MTVGLGVSRGLGASEGHVKCMSLVGALRGMSLLFGDYRFIALLFLHSEICRRFNNFPFLFVANIFIFLYNF